MLGILPWLRKIRICILQHFVLIAVAELLLEANIPGLFMILGLFSTLHCILIRRIVRHESTSHHEFGGALRYSS